MNYQQHVRLAREYGLPPLVVVDQVLPTITRTRDSTMSDLNWFSDPSKLKADKHNLQSYVRKHGLDYALLEDGKHAFFYVFREEDCDIFRRAVEEVRTCMEDNPKDFGKATEMMGHILGYSECCVDAVIDNTKLGINFHKRVRAQLLEGDWVRPSGTSISIRRSVLPSFYTAGYAPCKPDCKYSVENGSRILDGMPDMETREAYERFLINNILFASADPREFDYDAFRELMRKMSEIENIAGNHTVRIADL